MRHAFRFRGLWNDSSIVSWSQLGLIDFNRRKYPKSFPIVNQSMWIFNLLQLFIKIKSSRPLTDLCRCITMTIILINKWRIRTSFRHLKRLIHQSMEKCFFSFNKKKEDFDWKNITKMMRIEQEWNYLFLFFYSCLEVFEQFKLIDIGLVLEIQHKCSLYIWHSFNSHFSFLSYDYWRNLLFIWAEQREMIWDETWKEKDHCLSFVMVTNWTVQRLNAIQLKDV